ncbi:MAG TPA: glycosyltransferase family 39 protein, partial [Polyangia bacterium]|nr:glycosyltransferase family 39 protein [Polyangia bacterium]
MSRRLGPRLLLAALVALGLALRLWGIGFSASTPVGRPDEEIFAVGALHMFGRPYDRYDTGWPGGFFVLWHAVLWIEHLWYRLRYGGGAGVDMGCLVAVHPLGAYLPVRVVSAALGAGTSWIVARTAAEVAPERPAAPLWAAALYAVNYLVGRDGHFAVSDAPLCFEIALALLCCARAVTRDARWLAAAAFVAGTAFSTKYSAVGLLFAGAAVAVEIARREPARARVVLPAAVAAFVAGVLLWSPGIATHWSAFGAGFLGHFSRYRPLDTPAGAIFYPGTVFPAAFGWAGFLLALVGLGLCLRRRAGVFLGVYAFMFFACVLGPVHAIFVRYASPVVPALAVAGGLAAAALGARFPARLRRPAEVALALALLAPP